MLLELEIFTVTFQSLSRLKLGLLAVASTGLLVTGCAEDFTQYADQPDLLPLPVPCGIRDCSVGPDTDIPDYEPGSGLPGKEDAARVETTLEPLLTDGVLDANDVLTAFDAMGNNVSDGEIIALRDALDRQDLEVTDEARALASDLATTANLWEWERSIMTDPANLSYGGHAIPEAVQQVVARARLSGAIAYDVNEIDEDDGEGVWNPYPPTTPAVENMTFEYTEITPDVLWADMNDTTTVGQRKAGTEQRESCDPNTGECQQYSAVVYREFVGGTGDVVSEYDEAYHEDIYARGQSGQRWANNCAILSDGSIHCLPAARRSVIGDLILTNPHLSRCSSYTGYEEDCRHMLYNGHFDIQNGVVVGVEMSGRLSKRAARGKAIFIDPIAVLEAWGFEVADYVNIRYGNTSDGVPYRDVENGVIRAGN